MTTGRASSGSPTTTRRRRAARGRPGRRVGRRERRRSSQSRAPVQRRRPRRCASTGARRPAGSRAPGTGGTVLRPAAPPGGSAAASPASRRSRSRRSQPLSVSSRAARCGAGAGRVRRSRCGGARRAARPWRPRWTGPWPGSVERARRTSAARSGGTGERCAGLVTAGASRSGTASRRAPRAAMSPSWCPSAAGTATQADQAVRAQHDVLGGQPAHGQADPVRLGDALGEPADARCATSRSGSGPRVSRSARVSPSIHSLTTYAAPPGAARRRCPRRRRRPSPAPGWPGRRRSARG